MKFGELLRELRANAKLTQEELAARAEIPVGSLRNHEQGYRVPSWSSVVALAKALGVSTDVFARCDEVATSAPKPVAKRGKK